MKKEKRDQLVILNLIQDLRRVWRSLRNSVRGRSQIKCAMPPLFNKRAFTLIELLVVVLIIGILAAIALPQYQKAVAKARAVAMLPLLRQIVIAEENYYLINGSYQYYKPTALDLQMPAECTPYAETGLQEYWRCGTDWMIDFNPTNRVFADYCPGGNTDEIAMDCRNNKSHFRIFLNYSHPKVLIQTSTEPFGHGCIARTSLGRAVCNSLFH